MNIIIRNASGQPIYDQIYTQIKAMVLSGQLQEGDALPSMRTLARDLRISVITTKRAYEELERDGFLVSVPGKGSFVAQTDLEIVREEHLKQIESHLQACITLADQCGLSRSTLIEMLTVLYEGE